MKKQPPRAEAQPSKRHPRITGHPAQLNESLQSHQTQRARPLPRCCTSAEKHKSLCVFHVLHAGSSGPTWLPGTPGPLEGGEPETKPLASVLLSPAHSASVPSMVGASSQLWREGRGGGSSDLHSQHSPLTQKGTL